MLPVLNLVAGLVESAVVLLPVAVDFGVNILNVVGHLHPLEIGEVKILVVGIENHRHLVVVLLPHEGFPVSFEPPIWSPLVFVAPIIANCFYLSLSYFGNVFCSVGAEGDG